MGVVDHEHFVPARERTHPLKLFGVGELRPGLVERLGQRVAGAEHEISADGRVAHRALVRRGDVRGDPADLRLHERIGREPGLLE